MAWPSAGAAPGMLRCRCGVPRNCAAGYACKSAAKKRSASKLTQRIAALGSSKLCGCWWMFYISDIPWFILIRILFLSCFERGSDATIHNLHKVCWHTFILTLLDDTHFISFLCCRFGCQTGLAGRDSPRDFAQWKTQPYGVVQAPTDSAHCIHSWLIMIYRVFPATFHRRRWICSTLFAIDSLSFACSAHERW
jgi:hypothetical protein